MEDVSESLDEYDLVIDNQIDFIKEEIIAGVETDEDGSELPAIAKSVAKTLQEVRKTLPMYPFRDRLLQAIEKYNIIFNF